MIVLFLAALLAALLVLCSYAPVLSVFVAIALLIAVQATLIGQTPGGSHRLRRVFARPGARSHGVGRRMLQHLVVLFALSGAFALCACSQAELSEASSLSADLNALLSTAEGNGSVPTTIATDINEAISGINTLASSSSASVSSGASTETTVVGSLESAVTTVAADLPSNTTVQTDAAQAEQLLGEVNTSSTETGAQQAEAAVGTFLVDYLAAKGPAGAALGAAPSAYENLLADARTHIRNLQS